MHFFLFVPLVHGSRYKRYILVAWPTRRGGRGCNYSRLTLTKPRANKKGTLFCGFPDQYNYSILNIHYNVYDLFWRSNPAYECFLPNRQLLALLLRHTCIMLYRDLNRKGLVYTFIFGTFGTGFSFQTDLFIPFFT